MMAERRKGKKEYMRNVVEPAQRLADMLTAPPRDLTAERAATDMYNRLFSVMRLPEHEHHAKARLKLFYQVTRQEALRELRERLEKREQFYTEQEAQSEGQMRLTRGIQRNEASGCIAELDRLTSEGAPSPIDLSPKLKDDGGYGEHF